MGDVGVIDVLNGLSFSFITIATGCFYFIVRVGQTYFKEDRLRLFGVCCSIALLLAVLIVAEIDAIGRWLSGEWRGIPVWSSYEVAFGSSLAMLLLVGFVSYPRCAHKGWLTTAAIALCAFVAGAWYSHAHFN